MGDADNLKSPKGKSVINKIGGVLSPRKYKLMKKHKEDDGSIIDAEYGDDKGVSPPTTRNNVGNLTRIDAKEQSDDSDDNKSADLPTFFYEGKESAEFSSSPFTAQYGEH